MELSFIEKSRLVHVVFNSAYLQINTFMRFKELEKTYLNPYSVTIALSDYTSAETIVYADTPGNAWMVASKQFGNENIISVSSPYSPVPKQDLVRFWKDRLEKFSKMAKSHLSAPSFADRAEKQVQAGRDKLTAKAKADKARQQLGKITRDR